MAILPISSKDLYPSGELTIAPLAEPLGKPSIVPSSNPTNNGANGLPSSVIDQSSTTEAKRRKHESYNLSGSVFLITGNGQKLRLPVPSNSPTDPLGWTRWKRFGALVVVYWYSAVSLTSAQAAGVMMRGISIEFGPQDIKPWDYEVLVTAPTLFMGLGAFLWVPLTIGMGRRPVFLLASLMMMLATLGAGSSQSFQQLLACICFLGLGEGFALAAAFLIIIDMTYIDERPKAIAILWSVAGFFGTAFVAIIPYMSDQGHQWRQYFRYWTIPALASFLLVFFFFPETYFKRPTVAFDGLIVLQSATEKLTVYKNLEAESDIIYRDLPELPQPHCIFGRFCFRRSPFASWISMGRCFQQIVICAANPLIFWVFMASSVNIAGMVFIGATHTRVLEAPPYNLSVDLITPVNMSYAVGTLFAYPLGVLPVEKIIDRLTKRNRGVREAEHYLIVFILPVITGAMSTIIYGLAVHYRLHYSAYYIMYGLNGFSWTALAIGTTLWVTEAFPRWAAPALAVLSGGSFLISFCMSFVLVPWVESNGFKLVGITLAVLQVLGGLVAVPIAFWGKSARQALNGRWADERGGALRPL